jgi:hypothetical protein
MVTDIALNGFSKIEMRGREEEKRREEGREKGKCNIS